MSSKNKLSILGKIFYNILFGIWYVISLLPLRVLYVFSTILSTILFYIVRYRRKIVHKNMKEAYPDISPKRLWLLERHFYVHFCDLFMESVKYISMSEKETRKRMRFIGIEQPIESCKEGYNVGLYLGHYGNWEWISSMPLWISPEIGKCTQLYHPLENKVFDNLIGYTRERFGGTNIPMQQSIRHFAKYRAEGKPVLLGFIADQVPVWINIHYWTTFLNHPDTPIFTGPEKMMKKFNMHVYYLDVRRVKRGYYTAEFKLMTRNPNECEEFYLTEQYTRMLNETINSAPSFWLWSHNRWKRTKAEYDHLVATGGKLC